MEKAALRTQLDLAYRDKDILAASEVGKLIVGSLCGWSRRKFKEVKTPEVSCVGLLQFKD